MIFSRRTILILIGSVAAIVGISLAIVLVINASPKLQNTVTRLANISTNTSANTNKKTNTSITDPTAQITYVARAFTERFGTTNNLQPDVILAATSFASPKLEQIIRDNVTSLKLLPTPKIPLVISTTARVFQVTSLTASSAHVVVSTTRDQTVGDQSSTRQQNIDLDLQLLQGNWKVTAATWQPQ